MRHKGYIRQRTKGSFDIRYSLGTDPLTGKQKRVDVTFKGSYKDAKAELLRLLRTIDTGEHIEPSKITVNEFMTQWLQTVHSQISPKTHERYEQIVKGFIVPAFGHSLLSKLAPADIQQAYNKWETSGRLDKKKGGLAPRSRLHIHRILSSALKHAVQLQLIYRNPASAVKPPKAKKNDHNNP